MDGQKTANAGIAALQFLGNQTVRNGPQTGAAIAFQRAAQDAEGRKPWDQLAGKTLFLEAFADDGNDLFIHEPAHRVADQQLVLRQQSRGVVKIQWIEVRARAAAVGVRHGQTAPGAAALG